MEDSQSSAEVSRRGLATLLGALGVAAGMAACEEGVGATTPEQLAQTSQAITGSGLTNALTISSSIASGATSVSVTPSLSATQRAGLTGRTWIALDAFTTNCEVVAVTSVSGSTITFSPATTKSHNSGAAVAVLEQLVLAPQLFGAQANGLADDTGAIQAAYGALVAQVVADQDAGLKGVGGTLYFPASPGPYMMSQTLSLSPSFAIDIRGDGWSTKKTGSPISDAGTWGGAGVIIGSVIVMTAAVDAIDSMSSSTFVVDGLSIRDLAIVGTGQQGSGFNCYSAGAAGNWRLMMQNVLFANFPTGLTLASLASSLRGVNTFGCGVGVTILNSTSTTFYDFTASNCGEAVRIRGAGTLSFIGGVIEGVGAQVGIHIVPDAGTDVSQISVIGMYIEGTATAAVSLDTTNFNPSPTSGVIEFVSLINVHAGGMPLLFVTNPNYEGAWGSIVQTTVINCDFASNLTVPAYALNTVLINNRWATFVDQGTGTQRICENASDVDGAVSLQINKPLSLSGQTTSNGATGGSNGAPPNQVVGYLEVLLNGTNVKVPYYNV